MSETLYRKYRPKNFSEIIGQAHIVRTLSNSIKNNRVGQAYLFTGPRGTGKTSIARILAKTINCANLSDAIPCEKCEACKIITAGKSLDIIEIDAASNTGVDNIRELKETVALSNASLKYKVYIIDEVHMLSTGAFNALLKTLEEPPTHVVFILATTEIHKVPETILSRCQRFDFARLPIGNIIEKLALIAKAEKVKIESEALEMIAISAEGGMRDAESLLGQIISLEDKNITLKEVEEILGTADKKTAEIIAEMIFEKNSSGAISKINELLENGYDLEVFNKSLINYLRQLMIIKIDSNLKKYFSSEITSERLEKMEELSKGAELSMIISSINLFLEAQSKISSFILPQLPLEIAIIKATQTFPAEKNEYKIEDPKIPPLPLGEDVRRTGEGEANLDSKNINSDKTEKKEDSELLITNCKLQEDNVNTNIDLSTIKSNWPKLLIDIRPYNHSLSALLSNCQPTKTEKNIITLGTPYSFYCERLNDKTNRLTVEQVFSKILKSEIKINIELDKNLVLKKEAEPIKKSEQNSLLTDALEIMGGKVVEE
ncbi:MAG: DNA polymerase III, subunit gamma and tau [Candidatus Moranbacteria bacterium RIFOXYA12_FULL_35_19]|nr:MAG: polymerase III, subunit gamma and tau protein [Candidatus Moranbacteria bacterium GW2011_GWF2_35_39]OGI31942.1 MAG: DNA polymerase III, subunit gamma and tau [Candidatus Moranbacteria bacterium RIFOXYB12_FULL_35_8]OGI33184.1 MAG: DNA polymerase III, subunit gamma and tau [Candidatus Moranbacteria bacterium RIFOXYC12_FULL_36_13]OGI36654.1 MAG: DNA polymerase III, subunit gamma and tau [Candidatus Moranbacteria bacterium RIFOXYA12_FULL_35_19]